MEQMKGNGNIPVLFLLKSLLFSYIVTMILLLLLTFALYQFGLSEKVVTIIIIGIYVVSTFFAGFITGKKMETRKFLWGLLMGAAYFAVLLVISLIAGQSTGGLGDSVATTMVLCTAGGMLGGMLS